MHLEGCKRCKHWAFVRAHDAVHSGEQTEQDGPFTQCVPLRLKEPDLSAPVPPALNQCPSGARTRLLFHVNWGRESFSLLPFNIWNNEWSHETRHVHPKLRFERSVGGCNVSMQWYQFISGQFRFVLSHNMKFFSQQGMKNTNNTQ